MPLLRIATRRDVRTYLYFLLTAKDTRCAAVCSLFFLSFFYGSSIFLRQRING